MKTWEYQASGDYGQTWRTVATSLTEDIVTDILARRTAQGLRTDAPGYRYPIRFVEETGE